MSGISNLAGTMTLRNVTISQVPEGPGLESMAKTKLVNTLIAGNMVDCAGMPPFSLGHNLDGDGSCHLTEPGDLDSIDPLLMPWDGLPRNGARPWVPNQVFPLSPDSPAVDAGIGEPHCPGTDQRRVTRPQGAGCDIGAYEFGGRSDAAGSADPGPADAAPGHTKPGR